MVFKEINTSTFLADNLKNFGYKVTRNIGTTGIVAELDSGVPGKIIGLRADMEGNLHSKEMTFTMDALKIGVNIETNIIDQTLGLK